MGTFFFIFHCFAVSIVHNAPPFKVEDHSWGCPEWAHGESVLQIDFPLKQDIPIIETHRLFSIRETVNGMPIRPSMLLLFCQYFILDIPIEQIPLKRR